MAHREAWRAATETETAAWLAGHISGDDYRETEHGLEVRELRPGGFRAQCQKGHDRIDFTDRAAFEAHMTGEHKAKRIAPGSMGPHLFTNRTAPGWTGGKIAAPYPHEAPKPARGGLEKLARDLEAGKYDVSLYPSWRNIAPERMGEVA